MQAIQQCPKLGECGRRGQGRSNGKARTLRRIGDPRGKSTYGAVRQLAENVLTFWEFRPPLNAKALAVERVKWVMNPDGLGTMGIMFLARAARGKRTLDWRSAWRRASRAFACASPPRRRWCTS
jgi:hypothetical protein